MGPGDLHALLGGLHSADERVLVDMRDADDAGALRISARVALLHTVDVITPIVDDPETFGRIAAANALSDIYAMGGSPTSAVSILGLPKEVPAPAVRWVMRGALSTLEGAGCPLLGGHTLKDKELKLGFAVTGEVDPKRLVTNRGAREGQVLVLSKGLGTGVLYQAMKVGARTPAETREVVRSMTTLNQEARDAMLAHRVRVGTDVTGFGLAGHALNIARASGVDLELWAEHLPALPGVVAHLAAGVYPGTADVNRRGCGRGLGVGRGVTEAQLRLACDPQTSGGLLMVVDASRAESLREAVSGAIVGRVVAARGKKGRVRLSSLSALRNTPPVE